MDPARWVDAVEAEAHGDALVLAVISNPVTRSRVRLAPVIEIQGPEEMCRFSTWFRAACTTAWNQVPPVDLTELDASDWRGGQPAVL